jgi:DNA-binding response OmpR family regulator
MERPSSPSGPLRVLLIEDAAMDEQLIITTLRRAGYDPTWKRVEAADEFKTALKEVAWDIVIGDYNLPRYSGLEALAELRASGHDTPFILVSGTVGESVAVGAMKAGAQDYVLKENLTRLPRCRRA